MKKLRYLYVLIMVVLITISTLTLLPVNAASTVLKMAVVDGYRTWAAEVAKMYENENPGTKIEFITASYDQIYEKTVSMLTVDKSALDIVNIDDVWIANWVRAGFVTPLDGLVADAAIKAVVPAQIEQVTYDGQVYAIPQFGAPKMFFYNTTFLKEAGFTSPPATWDELVSMSKVMQSKGIVKHGWLGGWQQAEGVVVDFAMMLGSYGGNFFENGEVAFNKRPGVEALSWMVNSMHKEKITAPASISSSDHTNLNAFLGGEVPFHVNWDYAISMLDNPELSKVVGEWGVAPMPASGKGKPNVSILGIMSFGIAKGSKNKEKAADFLSFYVQKDVQKKVAMDLGFPPSIDAAYEEEVLAKYPAYESLYQTMLSAVGRPNSITWYPEFALVLQEELHAALVQKKAPQKALNDAAKRINSLKKKYKGF